MTSELFGALPDGAPVHRWTLERAGVRVRVLSYGGIVQSVETPDRDGRTADVVLGFDELDGYLKFTGPFYGALIGRYANRIGGARFTLDGVEHVLPRNDGPNCLHGGDEGYDKRVWRVEPDGDHALRLSRVSPAGEGNFPGRLELSAVYALEEDGSLSLAYEAVTDAPTVVNLTNHSYWNLAGAGSGTARGHRLRLEASRYTPVDDANIPVGGPAEVAGTRFDFRGADGRLTGEGYDHNFVLDKGVSAEALPVGEMWEESTGRVLTVATTEPGMQVYTGDFLQGPFAPGDGVALETQHFPDSPNRPDFPSTVLRPGETFRSRTVYGFATR
ncbi:MULTISPECIES: aldose epimerase family protein [Streptomyces]|uniref:Aldose 1-epimerase n=2 Tax=Streptomyces chilikensis TaxID=1194079 RepID=A0ABV3EPW1_9ACTN|nr:aldose epimerase family protein [Streptomyces sp. MJP52]MDH6227131.1 aldose 1-epimerase [Streptomyces sp. MJP52]